MSTPMPGFISRITELTRLENSGYGNPVYLVTFANGSTYATQPDIQCAYMLTNPEYRGEVAVWLWGQKISLIEPVGRRENPRS